jgi:hypothetical protein
MNYYTTQVAVPKSFVTKGKQRLKQYNDTVYLNNGDEFEIELYNPTSNKILAKIEINGNSIGAGVVLRPGERLWLERYLNEAKKFLFETYMVDGGSKEVMKAIEDNGDVEVKFFEEDIPVYVPSSFNWTNNWGNFGSSGGYIPGITGSMMISNPIATNGTITTTAWNGNSTYTTNISNTSFGAGTSGTATASGTAFFNSSVTTDSLNFQQDYYIPTRSSTKKTMIETGRVEKGSSSSQSFEIDSSKFKTVASWISSWKLLPMSQKVLVKEDIKVFCTECGAKRKKDSHKFCPHCGSKF